MDLGVVIEFPIYLAKRTHRAGPKPSSAAISSSSMVFSRFRSADPRIRRRRVWVVSGIGEPAGEVEDACADEVPIAFGRQVLRLPCAELGRARDECRAESRPLSKCEIAIVGRREHDLAWSQP